MFPFFLESDDEEGHIHKIKQNTYTQPFLLAIRLDPEHQESPGQKNASDFMSKGWKIASFLDLAWLLCLYVYG